MAERQVPVEDGVPGYIVNPYDDAGVADRIAEIFSDPTRQLDSGRPGGNACWSALAWNGWLANT